MMRDPKTIEETVAKALEQQNVELVDLVIQNQGRKKLLQFFVDKEGGVTLDDCEKFHRAVQPDLEAFDYDFLEVCSPGIDRPIKTRRDVEKSIGLTVEAKMYKPVDGRKTAQGALVRMDEKEVVLAIDGEETAFPRAAVAQVRLVPDLSALDGAEDDSLA